MVAGVMPSMFSMWGEVHIQGLEAAETHVQRRVAAAAAAVRRPLRVRDDALREVDGGGQGHARQLRLGGRPWRLHDGAARGCSRRGSCEAEASATSGERGVAVLGDVGLRDRA